jgi:hypothetical protein
VFVALLPFSQQFPSTSCMIIYSAFVLSFTIFLPLLLLFPNNSRVGLLSPSFVSFQGSSSIIRLLYLSAEGGRLRREKSKLFVFVYFSCLGKEKKIRNRSGMPLSDFNFDINEKVNGKVFVLQNLSVLNIGHIKNRKWIGKFLRIWVRNFYRGMCFQGFSAFR